MPPARCPDFDPMRLILVRHGRPDEGDLDSPNDPPLNARRPAAGAGRGELAGERTHYAHRRQPIAACAADGEAAG